MKTDVMILIIILVVISAYLITRTEMFGRGGGGRGGGRMGGRGGGRIGRGWGGRGRGWGGRGWGRGRGWYGGYYNGWGSYYPWLYDDYYYYPYIVDLPSPTDKCLSAYKAAIDAGKSKEDAFAILKACL